MKNSRQLIKKNDTKFPDNFLDENHFRETLDCQQTTTDLSTFALITTQSKEIFEC